MKRPPVRPLATTIVALALMAVMGLAFVASTYKVNGPVATSAPHNLSTAPAQPRPARSSSDGKWVASVRRFAEAYGRFLDGGRAEALTGEGSITAVTQATESGRIPAAFRDGHVMVAQLDSVERTCCSASVTVVLANREERYPFVEQLLLEQHGWVVDQITPPDLSMDRNLRPPTDVTAPARGIAAARRFAVEYVDYRSGHSPTRPAMTASAARQITAGTDSLAGQTLPNAAARLVSIQVGPPSGSEFAATATVQDGDKRFTFSFLMVGTAAGWECGQYL